MKNYETRKTYQTRWQRGVLKLNSKIEIIGALAGIYNDSNFEELEHFLFKSFAISRIKTIQLEQIFKGNSKIELIGHNGITQKCQITFLTFNNVRNFEAIKDREDANAAEIVLNLIPVA